MDTAVIPSPRRNLKNLLAELHQLTLRTVFNDKPMDKKPNQTAFPEENGKVC